ncbi:Uncharacterised protein [Mycobacteroides abscessus subsp. massiliense]|nr:hypothetical protein [Mycobacteroides abscessus]SKM18253.1 Uncharacterised protein [Mycobacteroides abscessus subsp. massiliense]MDM2426903.1 hypothetical protein [Mycobacteroides abscessus]MDM2431767.1 hypothetical protein [Mycobacteroides abscessus]MDM2436620.1 hypothetical protein [Mycobacteroides abscessus]
MSEEISTPAMAVAVAGAGVGALTGWLGGPAFLIFLALKLGIGDTGVQDWSWWLITAPVWGGIALSATLWTLGLILQLVSAIRD